MFSAMSGNGQRRTAARAVSVAALVWGGLMGASAHAAAIEVVASFSILGDIVHEVGGDDVHVTTLVGPNGDAHSYEPTPANAKSLGAAKVLFVNGLDFETWLPGLTRSSGFKGPIVVASAGVKSRKFEGHDGHDDAKAEHGDAKGGHAHDRDPHAWQSLVNGRLYVQNVAKGLIAADPAHAANYQSRADAYVAKIDALQAYTKAAFDAIPAERKQIVTSHDAFGYFGDAYGVKFIAVAGVSTEAEPSAAEMAKIVTQVRQEKVPAVFIENITNPRLVQQIARETGAKVGGTLYSDALSDPSQPGATYLGMFEWNVQQITTALKP